MGLAVMTELPMIVINVQRGGPSTGLPTKTEQPTCCRRCSAATASARCRHRRPQPGDCFDVARRPGGSPSGS
jgi:2-oxoglutarate/2-oxoacid ferredoxin oxidoreductase subunit alpha